MFTYGVLALFDTQGLQPVESGFVGWLECQHSSERNDFLRLVAAELVHRGVVELDAVKRPAV